MPSTDVSNAVGKARSGRRIVPPVPRWLLALGIVLLIGNSSMVRAQVTTSSVSGFVTDSSGASVPGAVVTVREVRTGYVRTATTDQTGQYQILAIPSGEYSFTVQHAGFETVGRTGQAITQQLAARVDFVLQVGSVSQTVTVQGASPLLQTETPANSVTFSNQTITELPMLGHNYLQTATLAPGVTPIDTNSMMIVCVGNYYSGGTGYKPVGVSATGGRPDFTAYIQDGLDVRDPGYGGDLFQTSPEAVSSYRIVSGFDSAQFGGEPSIVYVSTKSGTNQYHGSVWEYNQEAALQARQFGASSVPPLTYNQGGFTFGGPALPQLKNKTFVFGEFQMTRMRSGAPQFFLLPTAAQWSGDLSAIPVQIYNPFNVDAATGTRQPFTNNQIPTNLLSSVAQKMKPYIPLPNIQNAGYGNPNFVNNSRNITDDTQFLIRVDQNLPRNGRMFAEYFWDNVNSESAQVPQIGFGTPLNGRTASVEWDQPLAANKLNTLRLSFYRSWVFFGAIPTSTDITGSLGLNNFDSEPAHWGFPGLSVTGLTMPSNVGYDYNWWTNRLGVGDNFSLVKGRHTLDFGGLYQPTQYPQKNGIYPRGVLSYQGEFTKQSPTSSASPIGLADFLMGAYATANSNPTGLDPLLYTTYFAGYAQDKIQATKKLSITLGMRWDWWSPPVERWNRWMTFDQNTGQLAYALADPFAWQTNQTLNSAYSRGMFENWGKKNFSPRIGFAYLVKPNTTVRAGGGIYFAQGLQNFQDFSSFSSGNPPFSNSITVGNDPGQLTPQALDTSLFPLPTVGAISPGSSLVVPDIHAPQPYLEQATFSVERQLGNNVVVTVGYNGVWGHHLNNGGFNINQASLLNSANPLPYSQRLPYPNFDFIFLQSDNSNSDYNGAYVSLTKRYSNGLSLTASYTWAKSMDEYTSSSSGGNNQNALCIRCDYGLADNNRTNYLSLGYVWELPFGTTRKFVTHGPGSQILGNWQFSGITQFMSGTPLTPTSSTSWINVSDWVALPRSNRICNGQLSHPTLTEYFNVACFPAQPVNTFGDSGRNVIIGPGAQLWDMALERKFKIRERFEINLRGEFYSVFNHQNWGAPDTGAFDSTEGQIFTKNNPRTIELGAKVAF